MTSVLLIAYLSGCRLNIAHVLLYPRHLYEVFRFTVALVVMKMKHIAVMVRLQSHTKLFSQVKIYGGKTIFGLFSLCHDTYNIMKFICITELQYNVLYSDWGKCIITSLCKGLQDKSITLIYRGEYLQCISKILLYIKYN